VLLVTVAPQVAHRCEATEARARGGEVSITCTVPSRALESRAPEGSAKNARGGVRQARTRSLNVSIPSHFVGDRVVRSDKSIGSAKDAAQRPNVRYQRRTEGTSGRQRLLVLPTERALVEAQESCFGWPLLGADRQGPASKAAGRRRRLLARCGRAAAADAHILDGTCEASRSAMRTLPTASAGAERQAVRRRRAIRTKTACQRAPCWQCQEDWQAATTLGKMSRPLARLDSDRSPASDRDELRTSMYGLALGHCQRRSSTSVHRKLVPC